MTTEYILSQVFAVLNYALLASTYLIKNRKMVFGLNIASLLANSATFFFLSAWSGLAMSLIAIFRNIILLIQNHFDKDTKNKVVNWSIFAFLVIVSAVSGYFTYEGVLSLFSVFATFVFTVSIWQKNEIVYKALGILCSILWIVYDVFIWSIFSFSCESILMAVEIVGLILAIIKLKKSKLKTEENYDTTPVQIDIENE